MSSDLKHVRESLRERCRAAGMTRSEAKHRAERTVRKVADRVEAGDAYGPDGKKEPR